VELNLDPAGLRHLRETLPLDLDPGVQIHVESLCLLLVNPDLVRLWDKMR